MNRMTNFALLMQVLALSPGEIAERLKTDTTLVSRWRTGSRRIMPDRHWAREITDLILKEDRKRLEPVVPRLLLHYEPGLDIADEDAVKAAAQRFLTAPGQLDPVYHQRAVDLINSIILGEAEPIVAASGQPRVSGAQTAIGLKAARKMALEFVEQSVKLCRAGEIVILCPEGLAILTDDLKYAARIPFLFTRAYKRDCHFSAVIAADCAPEQLVPILTPWLSGHLHGCFDGYLCADFNPGDRRTLLTVVRGHMALEVNYNENGRGTTANIHVLPEVVEALYQRCKAYIDAAMPYFKRGFLREPGGYLSGAQYQGEPCYMFCQLPQFGFLRVEQYASFYRVPQEKVDWLWAECAPLMQPVQSAEGGAPIRHMFCQNTIDDALLDARRMMSALSELTGQRVFMTAQDLVEALKAVRDNLISNKNYEVCFVPDGAFADLSVNIVSWGSAVTAVWIAGVDSTATTVPKISRTLNEYCAATWEKIPAHLRTRAIALKHIDQWLKKAQHYGLNV